MLCNHFQLDLITDGNGLKMKKHCLDLHKNWKNKQRKLLLVKRESSQFKRKMEFRMLAVKNSSVVSAILTSNNNKKTRKATT